MPTSLRIPPKNLIPPRREEIKRGDSRRDNAQRHPSNPRAPARSLNLRVRREQNNPTRFGPKAGDTRIAPACIIETCKLDHARYD